MDDDEAAHSPPRTLYAMMGVWSTITGLLGFFANLLAVFLFLKVGKLRTPFNYLLINLSVTELVISVAGNSVLAYNSFHEGWSFSSTACQANAFGMTFLGIQSIISLTVLALQRYMMVSQDRQFPLSTPLSTLLTLLFIWLYTAGVSIPPLVGWGEFSKNTLEVSCGVKWRASEDADHVWHLSYVIYIYMLGFLLPVSIISTSYYKIIKTIKFKAGLMRAAGSPHTISIGGSFKARMERDRKITIMVAIMIISFLVIWLPYACTSLAEIAGVPTMMAKSCVCIDPLIYFGLNPQFRTEMLNVMRIVSTGKKSKREKHYSEDNSRKKKILMEVTGSEEPTEMITSL